MIKKEIVKLELKIKKKQKINIGGNKPTFLFVQEQDGKLMMWVEYEVEFYGAYCLEIDIVETGKQFETQGKYVGSALMSSGEEYHVYAKEHYTRGDE